MRIRSSNTLFFWLTAYTLCVVMIGTNVPAPLYGLYSHAWHFSSGVVTLLFAVYAFTLVPSSLLFGQLSDRFGRKRMVIGGVLVAGFASFLFVVANGISVLLIARAVQGLCVGMLNGSAIATLSELKANKSQSASLVASVAIAVGTATGPLYSGILAQYAPFPIRLPYYVHFILLVPALFCAIFAPETMRNTGKRMPLHLPKVPTAIRTKFFVASFVAVAAWAVAGFFMVVAPTFVTKLVGIDNLAISGAVVFFMLGSSTVTQILFKRVAQSRAILTGFYLLGFGMVLVVVAITTHTLWLLILSTIVAGAGHGPSAAASLGIVTEIAPIESRADAVSSYYAIAYLGVSVPVLGLGFLAQWIGMSLAILAFVVVMVVAMLILLRLMTLSLRTERSPVAL